MTNAQEGVICIDSAEALIEISKNATTEEFTLAKSYELSADIDLSNEDFMLIPIFSGTLDGRGYTIKGLSISEKSTDAGLVGLIGEQGVVKNLNIEGNISPVGSKITVGGVVGTNKGIINAVNFSGVLKAYKTVGGIAGVQNGVIEDCTNQGIVYGRRDVGGIAGILEPYMEIAYESDTLDKLNRQLEVLNELSDEFSTQLDTSVNLLQEDSDSISEKQDKLKENFDNRLDYHKQEADNFDAGLDEKREGLDAVNENIASNTSDTADKVGDLRDRPSYSDIIKKDNSKLQNTIVAIKNISTISERMKSSLENKRGKYRKLRRAVGTGANSRKV